MLKKKIQTLVSQRNLGEQTNYEVIYDSSAIQILGGTSSCPLLTSCNNFKGDCPGLSTCGIYTDTPPA
jgi:hypothetical protein